MCATCGCMGTMKKATTKKATKKAAPKKAAAGKMPSELLQKFKKKK